MDSCGQETARISAALENLEEMLAQIERQRANESKLVYKLEHLVERSDNDEENLSGEAVKKYNWMCTIP